MTPVCPKCGGEVWDNRQAKKEGRANPKAPDFKCKDTNCAFVIWKEQKDDETDKWHPKTAVKESVGATPSFTPTTNNDATQLRIAKESVFHSICNMLSGNGSLLTNKSLTEVIDGIIAESDRVVEWVYKS